MQTFLSPIPLDVPVIIFFITGTILILIRDWRVSIAALLIQYLVMGVILVQLVRPEIAVIKVFVGLIICPMLYLSARQASWRRQLTFSRDGLRALIGTRTVAGEVFPPGRTFRLMGVLLLAVAAVSLARTYPLPLLPSAVIISVYWLALTGAFILMLTEEPLKVGQGLLSIFIGFELWYTVLEGSLILIGLWGIVNLLLALAIGYLTVVRGVNLEEDF